MPECLFERYVADLHIYHADRMMDQAQVLMFPKISKSNRERWWRDWKRQAARAVNSVLTFNGVRVSREGLKRMVRGVTGLETGVDVE